MSLDPIPKFVMDLLFLTPQADSSQLDRILDSGLQTEEHLREIFAQHRDEAQSLDPYIGITDVFRLPRSLRTVKSRYGQDDAVQDIWERTHIFSLTQEQRQPYGSITTVESLELFCDNFNIFSSNVLSHMNWSNVVVAGGSVLACLMPPPQTIIDEERLGEYYHDTHYRNSDIDIFLYGLSEAEVCSEIPCISS